MDEWIDGCLLLCESLPQPFSNQAVLAPKCPKEDWLMYFLIIVGKLFSQMRKQESSCLPPTGNIYASDIN